MKLVLAFILSVHGLIHLMGVAKAFGWAELAQLTLPISRPVGLLWLAAALLLFATTATLFAWPRGWWASGAVALIVSQAVIGMSWTDAKYGTIANVILLGAVVFGFLSNGPTSYRAEFDREATRGLARVGQATPVTGEDLAHLPAPVQRYLRLAGVVGQDRVHNFRARFRGQIRSDPDSPWMPFTADQWEFFDPPARLFLMDASKGGLPFQALHVLSGPSATMRVKAASLVTVAHAQGPEMDRSETVTLFNDMCVLAPATLIDRSILWEEPEARTVRARFTNGPHTISATLSFNDTGELTDFWSDDRDMSSPDGKTFTRTRWSTPMCDYREFGKRRIGTRGEARWHPATGAFAYITLEVVNISYNVTGR